MTQTAFVEAAGRNGYARVRVRAQTACSHSCEDCGGACTALRVLRVRAHNPLGARAGETVTIESATRQVIRAAALVYLLPLAALLAGYLLSAALGAADKSAALAGAGGLLAGCSAVVCINRRIRKDKPIEYTIVARDACSDT